MSLVMPDYGFRYRGGVLSAEDIALPAIAESVGTPFYCYSTAALSANFAAYRHALEGLDVGICYAVKANSNQAIIRLFASQGAGADVVSEGELRRALAACVPADDVMFSGVGKTRDELAYALSHGVTHINIESGAELELLAQVSAAGPRRPSVAVRVNPDVDAKTHEKITTGRRHNKFGVDIDRVPALFERGRSLAGIEMDGLAVHIGSQLTDVQPYRDAYGRLAELTRTLRARGHAIRRLDLGGGLGIDYGDGRAASLDDYAAVIRELVAPLGCAMLIEPGRSLTGNAGVLVTRVLYVKDGGGRTFLVVDAAMNDLHRPTLYDAHHDVLPVSEPDAAAPATTVDIVGPICETGDRFAIDRKMPPVDTGSLLAIASAGAYGSAMASTYNSRPLIPEVLVDGGRYAVIRPRQTYEAMLAEDRIPDWLEAPAANDAPVRGRRGVA